MPVFVSVVDVNGERPCILAAGLSALCRQNGPAVTSVGSVAVSDPGGSIYGEMTYALIQRRRRHTAPVGGSSLVTDKYILAVLVYTEIVYGSGVPR